MNRLLDTKEDVHLDADSLTSKLIFFYKGWVYLGGMNAQIKLRRQIKEPVGESQ